MPQWPSGLSVAWGPPMIRGLECKALVVPSGLALALERLCPATLLRAAEVL
jgi:hypothetical protein